MSKTKQIIAKVRTLDAVEMDKAVNALIRSGGRIDSAAHQTLVDAMSYAEQNGSLDHLSRIMAKCYKSANRTHMLTYIKAHVPVRWRKRASVFKFKKGYDPADFRVGDAASVPFWDWTAPKSDPVAFSAERECLKLRKRIEKARVNGEFDHNQEQILRRGLISVVTEYTQSDGSEYNA